MIKTEEPTHPLVAKKRAASRTRLKKFVEVFFRSTQLTFVEASSIPLMCGKALTDLRLSGHTPKEKP
jgi:hypothetical protein